MRLRITTSLHEIGKVSLAYLKFGIGQPSAKQFIAEPHPIGVENVALAVLGDLPDVSVAVVFFDLCAGLPSYLKIKSNRKCT